MKQTRRNSFSESPISQACGDAVCTPCGQSETDLSQTLYVSLGPTWQGFLSMGDSLEEVRIFKYSDPLNALH